MRFSIWRWHHLETDACDSFTTLTITRLQKQASDPLRWLVKRAYMNLLHESEGQPSWRPFKVTKTIYTRYILCIAHTLFTSTKVLQRVSGQRAMLLSALCVVMSWVFRSTTKKPSRQCHARSNDFEMRQVWYALTNNQIIAYANLRIGCRHKALFATSNTFGWASCSRGCVASCSRGCVVTSLGHPCGLSSEAWNTK